VTVRIDAAVSLCGVLQELAPAIGRDRGVVLQLNCASSGTLAQQIIHGSDADVFITASATWMDYLEKKELIVSATRLDLWSNRLVVITRDDAGPGSLGDLADARWQPMAMGDPDHVPSGQYARQALRRAGVWDRLATQAARAPDATAALMHVASGQCPVGIVYRTDARRASGVTVAFTIDADLHEPIRYVAAVVTGGARASAGADLLDWLASTAAAGAFEDAGFTVID
jgi:molybdate transport system substrate-binding protein